MTKKGMETFLIIVCVWAWGLFLRSHQLQMQVIITSSEIKIFHYVSYLTLVIQGNSVDDLSRNCN